MKKLLLALSLVLLALPAAAEAGTILRCGTTGDALGGLEVYTVNSQSIAIRETTMAGTKKVYTVAAPAGTGYILALERGLALTVYGASSKTNYFGGGASEAVLLTLTAKPAAASAHRTGYYARGGFVFVLSCTN